MKCKRTACLILSLLLVISIFTACGFFYEPEPQYNYEWTELPDETVSPFVPNTFGAKATTIRAVGVHYSANPADAIFFQLSPGEAVTVAAVTHYGETTLACVGNGWIPIDALLFEGCSTSGAIPCTVKGQGLRCRTGPGTDNPSKGELDRGAQILVVRLFNCETDGKPWAMMPEGYWVSAEYLQFPEGCVVTPGFNTADTASQNPGTSTATTPSAAAPTTPQGQKPGAGQIQQTPNSTPIIGTWEHYDAQAFLTRGVIDDFSITFYNDGTFYTAEGGSYGCYSYDSGSFYSGKGGAGEGGIFTYDGTKLILQFDHLWYAGEYEPFDSPRVETYSASISGDYLTFNNTTYRNYDTLNDSESYDNLPRTYMAGATGSYVKSEFVGSWQKEDGSVLTLNSDGTFTETDQNGNTYTGDHLVVAGYLYLSRTAKNGSPFKFYIYGKVSATADTMTLEIWDMARGPDTFKINYTRIAQ